MNVLQTDCARAEVLAGAIALGEAGDSERLAYRSHLATCRRCLSGLGGEREIERVIGVVSQARDEERWEPQLRTNVLRAAKRGPVWPWSAAAATLAAAGLVMMVTRAYHPAHQVVVPSVTMPAESNVSTAGANAVAAFGTQRAPQHVRAESLAFGGEGKAVRSVTLHVSVDEHGRPTRCTVIAQGGQASSDAKICRAVMLGVSRPR